MSSRAFDEWTQIPGQHVYIIICMYVDPPVCTLHKQRLRVKDREGERDINSAKHTQHVSPGIPEPDADCVRQVIADGLVD
jgi:hypothetical protein